MFSVGSIQCLAVHANCMNALFPFQLLLSNCRQVTQVDRNVCMCVCDIRVAGFIFSLVALYHFPFFSHFWRAASFAVKTVICCGPSLGLHRAASDFGL